MELKREIELRQHRVMEIQTKTSENLHVADKLDVEQQAVDTRCMQIDKLKVTV